VQTQKGAANGEDGKEKAAKLRGAPSANPQIFRWCFAAVFRLFVAHLGTLIEGAQAGSLDGRNVHEHILAAVVGLNKSETFGRVEPLHGTCRHVRTPFYTACSLGLCGTASQEKAAAGGRISDGLLRHRKWHSFKGTKRQAQTECSRLIAITLDIYLHLMPNMQGEAAAAVDGVMRAAINKRADDVR
jgi:hypothetical protein